MFSTSIINKKGRYLAEILKNKVFLLNFVRKCTSIKEIFKEIFLSFLHEQSKNWKNI